MAMYNRFITSRKEPAVAIMDTAIQQPEPAITDEEPSAEECEILRSIGSDATPQEFYAAITKREDVRAILAELASS